MGHTTFLATRTYRVHLNTDDLRVARDVVNNGYLTDKYEQKWDEEHLETDLVYAATSACDGGDMQGTLYLVCYAPDPEAGLDAPAFEWELNTNVDATTASAKVLAQVRYECEDTNWDYEGE